MITHLITVTVDYIDSEHESTHVIECDKQLLESDTALLNYLLGCDVEDDNISIVIELLDDIKKTVSVNDIVPFMIVEKTSGGELSMRTASLPITGINQKSLSSLFKTDGKVNMTRDIITAQDNSGNYSLAIDLNMNNADLRERTANADLSEAIKDCDLNNESFLLKRVMVREEKNFHVDKYLLYFPDSKQFLEYETTTTLRADDDEPLVRVNGTLINESGLVTSFSHA